MKERLEKMRRKKKTAVPVNTVSEPINIVSEIGFTAGDVFNQEYREPTNLGVIVEKTGEDKALTCMAIGWLAREGKVKVERQGKRIKIKVLKQ